MAAIYFELHQSKMDKESDRYVVKLVLYSEMLDGMSTNFHHKILSLLLYVLNFSQ